LLLWLWKLPPINTLLSFVTSKVSEAKVLKRIVLSLAALLILGLPATAYADVFTFNAPPTAPNDGSGGPNQFDLDHFNAYTWRVSNVTIPAGHQITSATLTITSIRNWDANPNTLFIHLLDTARTYNTSGGTPWHSSTVNGVTRFADVNSGQVPVTAISDAFLSSNPLVAAGTADTLLAAPSFTTTARTYVLNLTQAQITALAAYIANGSDFAFGFDSDCHFWNNGIRFSFTTAPTATPEPITMALLGSGLAGFGYLQRRRRRANQE
jgi:hypothetical protein